MYVQQTAKIQIRAKKLTGREQEVAKNQPDLMMVTPALCCMTGATVCLAAAAAAQRALAVHPDVSWSAACRGHSVVPAVKCKKYDCRRP